MKFRKILCLGVAVSAITTGQANAADIILVDQGFSGTPAQQAAFKAGFQIAAAYWGSVLSNNVTIRLGVGTAALGTGIIGQTGSTSMDYSVANWEARVNATKSNSAVDSSLVLPTLTNGAAAFITSGPANAGTNRGINTAIKQYDTDTTGANATDNKTLYLNTANIKAIGGAVTYDPTSNPDQLDGSVEFSSNFGFDFDPTNGVDPNTFDFIGVAIHEIGHALGFVSGVDFLDYFGRPNGPGRAAGVAYNFDQTSVYSALDMFRYSTDPTNVAPGTNPVLDLAVGSAAYFSVDGGLTQFNGNSLFATGTYNGDGDQASHWKDASGANACGPQIGIMDPTFCYQQIGEITALDLAAFDAIGYNIAANARGTNYRVNTASIYRQFATAPVPEPATWAMLMLGFGGVGFAMRRNRKVTARIRFA
jgi:hypothetical protein